MSPDDVTAHDMCDQLYRMVFIMTKIAEAGLEASVGAEKVGVALFVLYTPASCTCGSTCHLLTTTVLNSAVPLVWRQSRDSSLSCP